MTVATCVALTLVALATSGVAAGCGGSDEDAPHVTLTDDGCSYEVNPSPRPGLFDVAVENATSRFAYFAIYELNPGVTADDVRTFWDEAKTKWEARGTFTGASDLYRRPVANTATDPRATSLLPMNESSGRYVVQCAVLPSSDTRQTSTSPVFPDRVYIAAELDMG